MRSFYFRSESGCKILLRCNSDFTSSPALPRTSNRVSGLQKLRIFSNCAVLLIGSFHVFFAGDFGRAGWSGGHALSLIVADEESG